MTKSNHDKKRCDRWVWGSNCKIYVQTDDLCFDSLAEISIQVTFDVFLMLSRNQKIISPANFFFSLSLSHTTHTLPVSEFLNLHNTLHYLSRDALHAALSSLQVFEVTRSSHHLTYFIKNTWDTPQTGSLSLSLSFSLLSSIKLPDGQKLPHIIHLRSEPFPHLSLHVTNEMNTSLHSETCVHILHTHAWASCILDGEESIKRSERERLCWRLHNRVG